MIRFSWRRGAEPIAHVSCTWSLSQEDLANICAAFLPASHEELERPRTKAEIEEAVRDLLHRNASQRYWWTDNYAEGYDREPGHEEVLEWGRRQAARF